MVILKNEIHYTDYLFQKFCKEKYGINRGVYNTIDRWLYEKGLHDILFRRKELLEFLKFVSQKRSNIKNPKLKFGHGGLKNSLNEFWILNNHEIENIVLL